MRRVLTLVALLAAVCAPGCATRETPRTPIVFADSVLYREGDDPSWSAVDLSDSAWSVMPLSEVHGGDGIYWLRVNMNLEPRHIPNGRPMGLQFSAMATAEIFWDSVPLPALGTVGATPEEEVPGPIHITAHLPNQLAGPGAHVIALRVSSHHRGFEPSRAFWMLLVGDYERLIRFQPAYAATALFSLSGMLIVGLYFLALFVTSRRESSHLLLAALCLAAAALLVAEAWRPLVGYTYDWHITRLRLVTALTYAVNLLLIASVATLFPLRGRWIPLAAGALLLMWPIAASQSWDTKQVGMFMVGILGALLWSAYATLRRQPGAIFAVIGLAGCYAVGSLSPFQFVDQRFFIVLDVLLLGLLVAHAFQIRRTRRERELALLKSARLEAELLRRHMQPHFLMNTLTALSDWVEEDPRVASQLIHALADEFRALSAIADRPLITVGEELSMCQSHIEVMGLRKGCEIRLLTDGLDDAASIPPAVFHTLVENAITHGPSRTKVEMRLCEVAEGRQRLYVFEAPVGEGVVATSGREGTGLRYVRSRLEEAFGADWSMHREVEGGVYRTELRLPAGAG